MQERRSTPEDKEISAELINKGIIQLEAEICILENWLSDLDETREDNPASQAARKSYGDMLQSRQELLESLKSKKSGMQN